MKFEELDEFRKDLRQLLKKYHTLKDDLAVVKKVLEVNAAERPPFSFRLNDAGVSVRLIKIKNLACRSMKGDGVNSGLRLLYAWLEKEQKVVFIELYHKNEREKENLQRVRNNFD